LSFTIESTSTVFSWYGLLSEEERWQIVTISTIGVPGGAVELGDGVVVAVVEFGDTVVEPMVGVVVEPVVGAAVKPVVEVPVVGVVVV
jgi:hypothetical protein